MSLVRSTLYLGTIRTWEWNTTFSEDGSDCLTLNTGYRSKPTTVMSKALHCIFLTVWWHPQMVNSHQVLDEDRWMEWVVRTHDFPQNHLAPNRVPNFLALVMIFAPCSICISAAIWKARNKRCNELTLVIDCFAGLRNDQENRGTKVLQIDWREAIDFGAEQLKGCWFDPLRDC